MTIGIYCLQFEGTDQVYIGKSKHIEKRYKEHVYLLKNNQNSFKLQKAYEEFGLPTIKVLIEDIEENLDDLEKSAIEVYNSYISGLNSTAGGTESVGGFAGTEAPRAKWDKEQIIQVLNLLIDTSLIPYARISEISGISVSSIRDIASNRTHIWLKEELPKEYELLLSLKNKRKSYKKCAKALGIVYPILLSPSGKVYQVDNIVQFAKEHTLNSTSLGRVLRGTQVTHNGWKLQ